MKGLTPDLTPDFVTPDFGDDASLLIRAVSSMLSGSGQPG